MKKLFYLLSLFPLCASTGCAAQIHMPVYPDAEKYLIGNQTYEGELHSIDIDWKCDFFTLKEDASINGAIVSEEPIDLIDDQKVHSYYSEGKLNVRFCASGYYGVFNQTKRLTITFNPTNIKNLNIGLTSGHVEAEHLQASESINVLMTSGETKFGTLEAPNMDISLTSGSFNASTIQATAVKTTLTSGRFAVPSLNSKTFQCHATSGTMDIGLTSLEKGDINLTSGSLTLKIPKAGATATIDKTSGSLRVNREHTQNQNVYTFGNGTTELNLNMTSGSITLN